MLLYANYSGFLILFVGIAILSLTAIASISILCRMSSHGKNHIKQFFVSLTASLFCAWGFIRLSVLPDGLNTLTAFFTLFVLVSIMGAIIIQRKKENKILLGLGYILCWTTILTLIISLTLKLIVS